MIQRVVVVLWRVALLVYLFDSLVPSVAAAGAAITDKSNTTKDDKNSLPFVVKPPRAFLLVESDENVATNVHGDGEKQYQSISLPHDISYDAPFTEDHYRPEVARVLRKHVSVTGSTTDWDEADWLMELCVAHTLIAMNLKTEKTYFRRAASEVTLDEYDHLKYKLQDLESVAHLFRALVALDEASTMYEREYESQDTEGPNYDEVVGKTAICMSQYYKLAMAWASLAELYVLANRTHKTERLYKLSKKMFTKLLSQSAVSTLWDDATRRRIELSLADSYQALGRLLLNGDADYNDADTILAANGNEIHVGVDLHGAAHQVAAYLTSAIDMFRKAIERGDAAELKYKYLVVPWAVELSLAIALQDMRALLVGAGHVKAAVAFEEEAVEMLQITLAHMRKGQFTHVCTMQNIHALGEGFLALADAYFRLGQYETAKDWYTKCSTSHGDDSSPFALRSTFLDLTAPHLRANTVQWHEMYRFRVARFEDDTPIQEAGALSSAIADSERELDTLTQSANQNIARGSADGSQTPSGRLQEMLEEADLRLKLGTLFAWRRKDGSGSKSDTGVEAIGHLEAAIQLYDQSGNTFCGGMGLSKYILAIVRLRHADWRHPSVCTRKPSTFSAWLRMTVTMRQSMTCTICCRNFCKGLTSGQRYEFPTLN